MHIPDGFLDLKTAAATGALAASGLGIALRRSRLTLTPRQVPLLGLAAAFVFVSQMLNFPVAGGTSGHLIGATLTATLLGPSAAIVVISCVLVVQCFLFADGGITALGANIFNMAIIGGVGGWAIYFVMSRLMRGLSGRIVAATFAAWCASVAAAIACAGELALSKTVAWNVAFPMMAGVHMLIGVGEGIITALVLAAVSTSRPDLLLDQQNRRAPAYGSVIAYGLLIAIGLALFVSPFASTSPDGLEWTAGRLGLEGRMTPLFSTPMPRLGTSIAALIGTAVALCLGLFLARMLVPRSAAASNAGADLGVPPGSPE